jgi:hypothetical protein
MSQTSYPINMSIAQVGQLLDTRNRNVGSLAALEAIGFGLGVCHSNDPAKPNTCRLPRRTVGRLTLSADLIASNVINGTVNGEAMDAVTYAVSHDNTMDLLITALNAMDIVARASLMDATGDNRIIALEVYDADVALTSWAVTLGSSQATVATAVSAERERFAGVSMFSHTKENPGTGGAAYAIGDSVSVLNQGGIWVPCVDIPTLNPSALVQATASYTSPMPAHLIVGGTDKGKFAGWPAPGGATVKVLTGSAFIEIQAINESTANAALVLNLPA